MLNKLALRNACRLWKDYLNYFFTLCMVTAFMYAFHSLLFSEDIHEMIHYGNPGELSEAGTMLITFMAISTVIILIVTGWLINYMTRFILEKRSREFAVYLLSGMKRKQVAGLYRKENLCLGAGALLAGLILGGGLRQVLFIIFYKSVGKTYVINPKSVSVGQVLQTSLPGILLTVILYAVCFMTALIWNHKHFSHMEIIDLIHTDRQNDMVKEKSSALWKRLFFLCIGNIIFLYGLVFSGRVTRVTAALELAGLIFTFYFFYLGLSAFLMQYIRSKGCLIYKGDGLFLLRQFSSKIRNLCFVMGTLSILFTFALAGSSLAFMLSDYQNKQLDVEYPFDVIMISDDTGNDFAEEEALLKERIMIQDIWKYVVYQNGTCHVGDYLYENLRVFSDKESDLAMAEMKRMVSYYDYDIYMGITDYNHLRSMLGMEPVVMQDGQFMIHMPDRVYREISGSKQEFQEDTLSGWALLLTRIKETTGLTFAGVQTGGFAQNGHNGADYLLVVPDYKITEMKKYFSLMAVMAKGEVPEILSEELYELAGKTRGYDELADYVKIGTEELFLMPATIQVASREKLELRFLMSTLSFPLFYIGLVFLCVSCTVLSVQQISDAGKYKFRYQILYKLGLGKRRIRRIVGKQLFAYYLCPVLLSAIISAGFVLYVGRSFVAFTGIESRGELYFGVSLASFLGIYGLYYAVTWILFVRSL